MACFLSQRACYIPRKTHLVFSTRGPRKKSFQNGVLGFLALEINISFTLQTVFDYYCYTKNQNEIFTVALFSGAQFAL